MPLAHFVSDLHGRLSRFEKLFAAVGRERPSGVFIGGDLLPHISTSRQAPPSEPDGFIHGFLETSLQELRRELGASYPRIFVILGNDDPGDEEAAVQAAASRGLWEYVHGRTAEFGTFTVYGYACVPPTPFLRKDWERYDVSRYVDPGAVSPEEGFRSLPAPEHEIRYATIRNDLDRLAGNNDLTRAIFLFHSPPYRTSLDLSAQGGRQIDHVPLDPHLGSIAVRRFIEERQPLLTLHGHVHESARLAGTWRDRLGRTHCFQGAHDGPELALVRFDPEIPESAARELL